MKGELRWRGSNSIPVSGNHNIKEGDVTVKRCMIVPPIFPSPSPYRRKSDAAVFLSKLLHVKRGNRVEGGGTMVRGPKLSNKKRESRDPGEDVYNELF
jgi:hypothetical protein